MTANNPDQDDIDPALDEIGDDFSYEEDSFDDEEFPEEESWEQAVQDEGSGSFDEDQQESSSDQPPKKKSKLFNIILIAVALLGGGAFAYLKVLSKTSPSPAPVVAEAPTGTADTSVPEQHASAPLPVSPSQDAPPSASITENPLLPIPGEAPESLTNNSSGTAIDENQTADAGNAMPADTGVKALAEESQPFEVTSAPPMPSPITAAEMPVNAEEANRSVGLPSARDVLIAKPVAEETARPPEGLSSEQARSIEQKLSVLMTRLDTFEGRIANLENGLHQMSSRVAEVQSAPAPGLDAINKTLQALDQKIAALEDEKSARPEKQPESVLPEQPSFVPAKEEKAETEPTSTAGETAEATKEAASPQVQSKTEKRKEPARSPAVAKTGGWVLRSAQPGSAMVAPKTGGDMKSVNVGDFLSGIGRVVSIEQQNNRWVVRGTEGSLAQ